MPFETTDFSWQPVHRREIRGIPTSRIALSSLLNQLRYAHEQDAIPLVKEMIEASIGVLRVSVPYEATPIPLSSCLEGN